jgi:hypothetical protein
MKSFLFLIALLCPAALLAGTNFTYNLPADGSTIIITPNQMVPLIMTVDNENGGIAGFVPLEYQTQTVISLATCPPEANPCSNYVGSIGPIAPFVLSFAQIYHGAVQTITFNNAPPGFYTIRVTISMQGCPNTTVNCNVPDAFTGSIRFTAHVVSGIGAPANALPHFAVGGGFVTDIFVINSSGEPASFTINFYSDSGAPASLPFNGLGTISILSDTVPPFGTSVYEAGDANAPVQGGWALITADPSLTIQELFRNHSANGKYYEASVPAYPGSLGFRMTFDATTFTPTGDPLYTGFAVANLDPANPATLTCTARDYRGTLIPNALTIPVLNPLGHWADYQFPALTGARGALDCTSNTTVSAIGLRFVGSDEFSSLPIVFK